MYILSQILVTLSDVAFIFSVLTKKKENIIFYLIISAILFGAQYACLQAWTGFAIAMIEVVYLIGMELLEKYNKNKYSPHLSIATMFATIALSILTWVGWISLLPMFAMLIYLVTMIFTNIVFVKTGILIRITLNLIYMFLITSYFGAILSILLVIFNVVGIVRDVKRNKTHDS